MTVHIVGGGIAGLSAALTCVEKGSRVILYEAAPDLGGRCRTYQSSKFGIPFDNGAHVILAKNANIQGYLAKIGTWATLQACPLDFFDLTTEADWTIEFPQCLWKCSARPPGVSFLDLIAGIKLFLANQKSSAAQVLQATPYAARIIWEPLCTAALNTPLSQASACDLAVTLKVMLRSRELLLPKDSLAETYIKPAQRWLEQRGTLIKRKHVLRDIGSAENTINSLLFDSQIEIEKADKVIMALPPWSPVMKRIGIQASEFITSPILNVHFHVGDTPRLPNGRNFLGLIGGQSQWLWLRNGLLSVTISAADIWMDRPSPDIAASIWSEIAVLIKEKGRVMPPFHIVKERRATLRHIPGLSACRPPIRTAYRNLFLAGDWIDTGLPCTLESAAKSGFAAAHRAHA